MNFVCECGAGMIRGVRPLQDSEAELTMMVANRQLDPRIETVVLMADKEFSHVSSSLIKQNRPAGDRRGAFALRAARGDPGRRRKMDHL